jgi:hypothetical protein
MAWFWTDDLARTLIDSGQVARDGVVDWISRPVAVAAPEGTDPAELGRLLLDMGDSAHVA